MKKKRKKDKVVAVTSEYMGPSVCSLRERGLMEKSLDGTQRERHGRRVKDTSLNPGLGSF